MVDDSYRTPLDFRTYPLENTSAQYSDQVAWNGVRWAKHLPPSPELNQHLPSFWSQCNQHFPVLIQFGVLHELLEGSSNVAPSLHYAEGSRPCFVLKDFSKDEVVTGAPEGRTIVKYFKGVRYLPETYATDDLIAET